MILGFRFKIMCLALDFQTDINQSLKKNNLKNKFTFFSFILSFLCQLQVSTFWLWWLDDFVKNQTFYFSVCHQKYCTYTH